MALHLRVPALRRWQQPLAHRAGRGHRGRHGQDARRARAIGQSYNLTADPCITANEYLDELERRAGIKLKRVPMPSWRSYTEAMGKWVVKAIGKDPAATMPSYADWQGRGFAARFDASKAEKELDWQPVSDRQKLVADGIHGPADEFIT